MTGEHVLATLTSMQANLKADPHADLKAVMSPMTAETSSVKTEMSSVKEDQLRHIHGVGAQLHAQIQEVSERLDRVVGLLDRNNAEVEGPLEQFDQWEKRQLARRGAA